MANAPDNDILLRVPYITSVNAKTKMPDWVAYRVTKAGIGKVDRPELRQDPLLDDSEGLEPEDYADAKQQIGMRPVSLVPFESFAATPYWKDIEYISNVIPMAIDLIEGPWIEIERKVRELASKPEILGVYVMAGTVYETLMPPLPHADELHIVPSGVWKIVSIKHGGGIKSAGFYLSQTKSSFADYCAAMVPIDEIEERTGLDFFPALNLTEQAQLEQTMPSLRTELGC